MQHETVIVLDFGGQYNQLIARRVRENNVYCEIYSYKTDLSVIKAKNPKGIIFAGGPNSVYLEDSPTIDPEIFRPWQHIREIIFVNRSQIGRAHV